MEQTRQVEFTGFCKPLESINQGGVVEKRGGAAKGSELLPDIQGQDGGEGGLRGSDGGGKKRELFDYLVEEMADCDGERALRRERGRSESLGTAFVSLSLS
ncbi:hypothetical protein B296_00001963 [Ensete ventricosum]|uniref:Uncharacterized protein n=1 Tax=Ensete ventricosum TaxID=4639 RepID=A0A427B024_ENSVE|nr:hypothetical protein B296_00001963 [Ensete ventricosum]